MKVVNLIEESKVGGPQIRIVRVALAMKSCVETVVFMPRSGSSDFISLCKKNNVAFEVLPITTLRKKISSLVRYILFWPYEVLCIFFKIREVSPDLIHISGGSWQVKGVLAAWMARKPIVWHLNDTSVPLVIKIIFCFFSIFSDAFIFASQRSKKYYGRVAEKKVGAVISSTVDVDEFCPLGEFLIGEKIEALISEKIVIGTVANINPVKGIEILIKALNQILQVRNDVALLIVGPVYDGQRGYFNRLEKMISDLELQDHVVWTGGQSDVRPFLKLMTVYVCGSFFESSPVSVWEAMSMGRAIVSTDVGDVPRHIEDGESGFIVPVGDDKKMASRILSLLQDDALRVRFGNRARHEAVVSFSPKSVGKKTIDIYRAMAR